MIAEAAGVQTDQIQLDRRLDAVLPTGESSRQFYADVAQFYDLSQGDMAFWNAFGESDYSVGDFIQGVAKQVGIDQDPGPLQDSINFRGSLFRWHERKRFEVKEETDFHLPFIDGFWKWEAQGRYAGADVNCGHFLGATIGAASAEAEYYSVGRDFKQSHTLLELDVSLEAILDLTRPSVIERVFRECVDDPQGRVLHNPLWMTHQLIAVEDHRQNKLRGGTAITDYIGWWALSEGYQGILFFGARAIGETKRWHLKNDSLFQEKIFGNSPSIQDLRSNPDQINIVLFSGSNLVDRTSRWRQAPKQPPRNRLLRKLFRPTSWIQNPYFQTGAEHILELSEFGEDYQESRQVVFVSKPSVS